MKKKLFFLALFAFYWQAYAQAPSNDECTNAISLTVNSNMSCTSHMSGTLVGATDSGIPAIRGTADDDVWFSFVATARQHTINILNIEGDITTLTHEVMSGSCSLMTRPNSSFPGSNTVTDLTVGNTYYVRVYTYGTRRSESTTFDICIGTPPRIPPVNDNCTGAIALTLSPSIPGPSCTSTTEGTLAYATDSGLASATGFPNDDVWYSFVATATSLRIKLSDIRGDTTNLVHEVISGSCGTLSILSSSNPDSSLVSGLTVGSTYYLRVFSLFLSNSQTTTFKVCVSVPPPPPANDECVNAVAVQINTDDSCTIKTAGTLVSATNSNESFSYIGRSDDDVWYTFVATATSHRIRLLNVNGDLTDLVHEVFKGSCGGQLESVHTSIPYSSLISGLTIGNTYYLRVFTYSGGNIAESTTFDLCISVPPPAPANDECAGAIALTMNENLLCTTTTSGTLVSATNSGITAQTGTADDDVWYSFLATANTHKISLTNVNGDITNLVHEVLDGTCGALNVFSSSDPNSSIVSGLSVDSTYYVRVFTIGSTKAETTTFDICITAFPPPPVNDECAGAIALTVNPDLNCTSTTSGTLVSATDSGIDADTGSADDDVWFSFVATATSHAIKILNVEGNITNLAHEVMDGSCGLMTILNSSNSNSHFVTGLTIGNTYYVRVYTYYTSPSDSTTFDICIGSRTAPPANDNCTDAIALTVNTNASCTSTTAGTIAGATDSGERPSSVGTADDDVWYTFVATATFHKITLTNVEGELSDLVHEVFEGTCGGQLASISTSNDNMSIISGLTIGTAYYVRVFSYSGDTIGSTTFNICVRTMNMPANDDCANAITLTASTSFAGGAVNSTVTDATDSALTATIPAPGCAGYNGGDVWYKVVMPGGTIGNLTIGTGKSTASDDTGFDSGLAVYKGTCNALELIVCNDNSAAATGNYSRITLSGRLTGEIFYIRVWENGNDEDEPFSISAWVPALGVPGFNNANFKAYPNPVSNILNLSYDQNISDVSIFNLLGQNVVSKTINDTNGDIDMSGLPSGSYLVKVTAEGQTKTIKVIKQ